jgi:hypothetical protein
VVLAEPPLMLRAAQRATLFLAAVPADVMPDVGSVALRMTSLGQVAAVPAIVCRRREQVRQSTVLKRPCLVLAEAVPTVLRALLPTPDAQPWIVRLPTRGGLPEPEQPIDQAVARQP